MSATEMAFRAGKLPAYQRLRYDDDDDEYDDDYEKGAERGLMRSSSSSRPSGSWYCRFSRRMRKQVPISTTITSIRIRRRLKLKVPSLRRLLFLRKKVKLVSSFRVSCAKVLKRFKEGQSHFGDLFAGNYLFLQVNPSSFTNAHHHHRQFHAFSSSQSYALPTNSKD